MNGFMETAGKKVFEKHLEQYSPSDPLYEYYTNNKGKQKKRRRALPPGLSQRDARILKSVQRRAHYLDKGFSLCGLRFGWTFFIGLIPIAGDFADATLNYLLVVRKCRQADIPSWLIRRMLLNNLVSAGVGLVPGVGDVVLAMYKANSRNAALLEEFLRIRGEEYIRLGGGEEAVTNIPAGKKKKGVSKADAEQVKPGSGMVPGEVPSGAGEAHSGIPVRSWTGKLMNKAHITENKGVTAPAEVLAPITNTATSGSTSRPANQSKRTFSLFKNRKNSTKTSTDSRFVEDLAPAGKK